MRLVVFSFIVAITYMLPEALAEARLRAGEVLVETEHPETGKWPLEVRAVVFVEAPPEEIWKVLTDFDHLAEFVPHMKESRIVSRLTNEEAVVKQVFRIFFLSVKLKYAVKMIPYSRVEFSGQGSKMRICRGCWILKPAQTGTLLTYEVIAHPDLDIPGWIMNWVLRRWIAKSLLAVRAKVLTGMGVKINEEDDDLDSLQPEKVY